MRLRFIAGTVAIAALTVALTDPFPGARWVAVGGAIAGFTLECVATRRIIR